MPQALSITNIKVRSTEAGLPRYLWKNEIRTFANAAVLFKHINLIEFTCMSFKMCYIFAFVHNNIKLNFKVRTFKIKSHKAVSLGWTKEASPQWRTYCIPCTSGVTWATISE